MGLTIEVLPDPAASDLRLRELVGERGSALERMNLLHGSALQRLSAQRMLAEANGGALTGVYGFTPVDLAQAAGRLGQAGAAAARRSWPAGADLAALKRMLRTLALSKLEADAPGVAEALLRSLTDLREAALSPDDLPDGDLRTAFAAWTEAVSTCADRSSRYEDAISPATPDSAFREALGGGPLIVSGIYDLTRIQRLLLARLSAAGPVRMLLVAPPEEQAHSDRGRSPALRTLAALRRELHPRVIRSTIAPAERASARYFSAGDPTAEADELAARILALGREGVAFNRIAILHQQGAAGDDRLCAALARADLPSWRIGGRQLAQTPTGRAALTLVRLLLEPEAVERGALLDWLSQQALRERPLGIERRPARWEGAALDAGLTRGLAEMQGRLEGWRRSERTAEADDLARLVEDLLERSDVLAQAESWTAASEALLETLDCYFEDGEGDAGNAGNAGDADLVAAVGDVFGQLGANDALGTAWTPGDGLTALQRAFRSRVVRDPRRLIGGVNVGAATGPVRGIGYDAVFVAGVAERIFPAVGRQDPLLSDAERAAINARIGDALALQGERADSDRHAWWLAARSARRRFTASWSRRSSAVGGPARPSTLILEAAGAGIDARDGAYSESALSELGRIERLSPSAIGAVGEGAGAVDLPDERSFDLALLTGADVDTGALLSVIRPETEAALEARRQRSAARFTEYDGLLDAEALADWRPLERSWSAAALETYVACPYRFYLREVIGVRAAAETERPDRQRSAGRLLRRILSRWAREYERFKDDRTWYEYAESASQMNTAARRMLDAAEAEGALGPPASVAATRREMMRDLDRARRREVADARAGWRPLAVNVAFDGAPVRVRGNRTLRLRGTIDRIDVHAGGRQRAVSLFGGRALPDVRGFVNGSSFRTVVSLAGLSQRGVAIREAEVEHRSVAGQGHFASQTLMGESLATSGGAAAPSDGERLRDVLALVADQLEAAHFIPYPGQPPRERANCRRCAYASACTADIGLRYEHKARQDQEAVRALEVLRRQRL